MRDLFIIVFCLIIIVVLLAIGIETGIFDAVSEAFYDWFHPERGIPQQETVPPMPLVVEATKMRVRRCEECGSIITGLDIWIVRADDNPANFDGVYEGPLYEAIYCANCGHQNIIGKYYRELVRRKSPKENLDREDMRKEEPRIDIQSRTQESSRSGDPR